MLLPLSCCGIGCLLGEPIEGTLLNVVVEQLPGLEHRLDLCTGPAIARAPKGGFACLIVEWLMMRIPAARIVLKMHPKRIGAGVLLTADGREDLSESHTELHGDGQRMRTSPDLGR